MIPLHAAAAKLRLEFDGAFSTTSGSSPVTSPTRTINTAGTLLFNNLSGGGSPQYSKNGGAFTSITEGGTLAMSGGDTLAVRATFGVTGTATFDVRNNNGTALIESVSLVKT